MFRKNSFVRIRAGNRFFWLFFAKVRIKNEVAQILQFAVEFFRAFEKGIDILYPLAEKIPS
jgi:hypothetical protein